MQRVLFEKLKVSQLVKKFSTFYGPRKFITTYKTALHQSLSWARSIQSTSSHPTSCTSIFILSSHLSLGLPSGLFPSSFPTKTLYEPLLHTRYMHRPFHSSRSDQPNNTWWGEQIIKLPHYKVFSPPISSLSHPNILLNTIFSSAPHPPTFLRQCERPSFKPNFSSVCLNL